MNSSDVTFLSEPTRQSPVAILLILMKLGKTVLRSLWPIVLVYVIGSKSEDGTSYFEMAVMGAALLVAISSIASYFRFYFYVKNEELIIEKGLFNRSKVNIPFDRIQTVNLQQNIIHQIFNVVSVEIDSAGSKGSEFSIHALNREQAYAIREYLLSRKSELEPVAEDAEGNAAPLHTNDEILLKLELQDLFKIGLTRNHLQNIGIIGAFFFGLYDIITDALGENVRKTIDGYFNFSDESSFFLFVLKIIPSILILSLFISLVNTALRYFDLRFYKTNRGFKLISGLFTRQEQSATFEKIQVIRWSSNIFQKYFGMKTLRLLQAASTMVGRNKSINVPGCYNSQVDAVRNSYFPEEKELEFESHSISPLIIFRRFLYIGILPGIGFLLLIPIVWKIKIPAFILWLIIVFVTSRIYHKNWKYEISTKGLRTHKGILGEEDFLLKWYKVQSIKVQQSLYQKRKGLADIKFYTAAGFVSIPYIPLENAMALKDYSLYVVESSTEEWM